MATSNINLKGTVISAPIWGGHRPAFLAAWDEIKKLGFKKRDRSFGALEDGTPALFFYATKNCCSLSDAQLKECKYEWYVTTETLERIED